MDPDFSQLDDLLTTESVDGYLVYADSTEADQYYLSGFDAPDPYVTLYDGEVHLLFARGLEYSRAVKEARAATVERGTDYGYEAAVDEYGRPEAWFRTLARFLEAYDVSSVLTPPEFPLREADGLRELGVDVRAEEYGSITKLRARKTAEEIDHIRQAQRANERAMARAHTLLEEASIDEQGRLVHGGDLLTSERVKRAIEMALLKRDCSLDDTIVACASQAADPHERGSGPLYANESIIIDIFPQHKETKYHADMTRTFVVGEPSETVREWYDLTEEAVTAALDAVEPGVSGEAVHEAADSVYRDAGLPTLTSDPATETGFIHSTGHGVGLEVHERPSVAEGWEEPLEPGHVITIEPGLYDSAVGGVRIEDLVVVTEDGYENLTDYEKSLVIE